MPYALGTGPAGKDGISLEDICRELAKHGIAVTKPTVQNWVEAGMPRRDPGRLAWIETNRPKKFKEKEPEQRIELERPKGRRYTREDREHYTARIAKFKAGAAKLEYDIAVGKVLTANTFMGILRRHIRTARLILLTVPNSVSSHLTNKEEQAAISDATLKICAEVIRQIVFAIEEACDEAGFPIKLNDDSRAYSESPIDGPTKEDAAT